jgi:ATP-dependent DNA helicase RecG
LDKLFFETGKVTGGTNDGTTNRNIEDLLIFIKINPGLSTKTIRTKMQIPQRTIERWIRELKKIGEIKFSGSNKTGGYYIV